MNDHEGRTGITRRDFLSTVATGVAATALPLGASASPAGAATTPAAAAPAIGKGGKPFNIVFIFTDQERYFRRIPAGFRLPGHERMARRGITACCYTGKTAGQDRYQTRLS